MGDRKYNIKKPEKCQTCSKMTDCEFLKHFFQKAIDVSGVLLDCKAFYLVFRELEERCHVPFDDPEALEQYDDDYLAGRKPYLQPALVTNGVLATELALKALTLMETGTFDCIHNIDKLFYALPEKHKSALSELIKEKAHQSDETLKFNLEIISNFFVEWRYFFQFDAIGYSGFLLDFIHIVCDYAIGKIESNATSDQ